jgi:hypothetical protein
MLGRDSGDLELADAATAVAEDAWRLFGVAIREMPHDGPTVRALVARKARHEALEGYWTAQALAKLGTDEGKEAEDRATQHGLRAERLTVTALDVASRLASSRPPTSRPMTLEQLLPEPEPRDEQPEQELDVAQPPPAADVESARDDDDKDGPTPVCEVERVLEAPAPPSPFCQHGARAGWCPIPTCFQPQAAATSKPWREQLADDRKRWDRTR